MIDKIEAVAKASYEGRRMIIEFRRMWMEKYPDSVDQTFYNLVMNQLDSLQTLVRLSAEVKK
jgi:hypothetical protein